MISWQGSGGLLSPISSSETLYDLLSFDSHLYLNASPLIIELGENARKQIANERRRRTMGRQEKVSRGNPGLKEVVEAKVTTRALRGPSLLLPLW